MLFPRSYVWREGGGEALKIELELRGGFWSPRDREGFKVVQCKKKNRKTILLIRHRGGG